MGEWLMGGCQRSRISPSTVPRIWVAAAGGRAQCSQAQGSGREGCRGRGGAASWRGTLREFIALPALVYPPARLIGFRRIPPGPIRLRAAARYRADAVADSAA